jgi:hypothetical protein
MLARLVKYDLLALARVLLPLQLSIFVLSLFTAGYFSLRFHLELSYSYPRSTMLDLLDSLAGFGLLLIIAVFLAGSFVTLFLVARHFYLNIYSDEGYLTMTLPATVNQHIISKAISGFIWLLINGLVMFLSAMILLIFGTAYEGLINSEIIDSFGWIISSIAANGPLLFIVYPLSLVIGVLSQLLCVYACLAAGCAWAKKHRIALALVLIVAVYIVMSTVVTIADVAVGLFGETTLLLDIFSLNGPAQSFYDYFLTTSLIGAVIDILLIVAYYAFTHNAFANRLNLE